MSDQPPLVPPTPPTQAGPAFEPYASPAYGDVAAEPSGSGQVTAPPVTPYPGPQGSPYQVAPQFLTNPGAPTHPLAITSLVLGITGIVSVLLTPVLGVTVLGGLCSPFAIWLGARAKREIRDNPQTYGGEGLAVAGFVTGIVGLVLGVLALLVILAFVVFAVWFIAELGSQS